ncbi:YheC/YheD family endospore coat-associated protein [Alteribacter natronophilus]|uniref:YheC/YheD family endospore coat-associated protein n=1 Tax=Alteribacter natronophilus TaxID=2583810 RepID=UPI0014861000|nr:YheC/YheD family protein [Alteribacter natronophilus]
MTLDFTNREHLVRFIAAEEKEVLPRLYIPESLALELGCRKGDQILLQAGNRELDLTLFPSASLPPGVFGIHHSLFPFPQLLSTDTSFRLFRSDDRKWRLGPVIGLLVNEGTGSDVTFGAVHAFAEELALHAGSTKILFFVYPYNQLWTSGGGSAFFYTEPSWTAVDTPLPDVMYNRLSSTSREQSPPAEKLFSLLKQNRIPYFNERFIYKWEMHEILERHEHLHPFLPKTVPASDREGVRQLVKQFGQLYMKPVHGREGNGIIRLTREKEKICLEYPSDSGHRPRFFGTFEEFYEALGSRLKRKAYLVQQGIPLISVDGGVTDIRALTVKNISGEWKVVSRTARCGVKDQIVSNVAKGGAQRIAAEVLDELFTETEAFHLSKMMNELAVEAATAIDSEIGSKGCFGEFGIDIGISTTGHPWIIEVNTKPSKSADPRDGGSAAVRPSARSLLAFSRYLSGF